MVTLITSVIAMFSIPKESGYFPTNPGLIILVFLIFGLVAYAIHAFLVEPGGVVNFLSRMRGKVQDATTDLC